MGRYETGASAKLKPVMRLVRSTLLVLSFSAVTALAQIQVRPLLDLKGETSDPSVSPDGKTLAFDWWTPDLDKWGLYTVPLSGGTPRLFAQAEDGITESPKWSPDGRWIAFLRSATPRTARLFIKPAAGAVERALGSACTGQVAWTANSRSLIVANNGETDSRDECRLVVVSIREGGPSWQLSDHGTYPAVSPDGRTLGFVRDREIHVLAITRDGRPAGTESMLVRENGAIQHLTWDPEHNDIVYLLGEDSSTIHRIESLKGAKPRDGETIDGRFNALSPSGNGGPFLAEIESYDDSFWRVDLRSHDPHPEKLRSLRWNVHNLKLSPDGKRLLYSVYVHGHSEFFASDVDGSAASRILTIPYEQIGGPAWSPDGRRIAFIASPGRAQVEPTHLFVVSATTGSPRRLVPEFDDVCCVYWSRDGGTLYFATDTRERWPLWKLNLASGQLAQVAVLSDPPVALVDESTIYRRLHRVPFSLLRAPLSGGSWERVLDQVFWFAIGKDEIYFIRQDAKPPTREGLNLYKLDLATRMSQLITHVGFGMGALQLSPDGRYLYGERDEPPRRDIMLVENP